MRAFKNSNSFQNHHGRAAAQVLVAAVLMTRVTEVAALILASRVIKIIKAIKAVTINNPARGGQQLQQSGYQSHPKQLNSG